jgi:Putative peptidoglycan binding domain
VAQSNDTTSQGPVGAGEYEVQQGDCLNSIAHRAGHFWRTIWDHPNNAELKQKRGDPNVLLPGDRLTIPPPELKEVSRPTEKRHRFVRKGEPAKLRLRVLFEDDRPRANQPFRLIIDGSLSSGVTDSDGKLEVPIPCDAQRGKLIIGPDETTVELALGSVDPITEISGVQGRLNNLGFNCGEPGAVLNNSTKAALKYFQKKNNLAETGVPDAPTRQKLQEAHGS